MEEAWPHLVEFWNKIIEDYNCCTITFSSETKICKSNRLNEDIMVHGGKSTNIVKGF